MKIVLDTNLYVSALQFGGKPMLLLQKGIDGDVEIAASQPIVQETLRVLRDKFAWSDEQLTEGAAAIAAATYEVVPLERLDVVKRDPSDNRILECAVAAGAQVLVSGDSDLLSMEVFRNIEIRKLSDFLLCTQTCGVNKHGHRHPRRWSGVWWHRRTSPGALSSMGPMCDAPDGDNRAAGCSVTLPALTRRRER